MPKKKKTPPKKAPPRNNVKAATKAATKAAAKTAPKKSIGGGLKKQVKSSSPPKTNPPNPKKIGGVTGSLKGTKGSSSISKASLLKKIENTQSTRIQLQNGPSGLKAKLTKLIQAALHITTTGSGALKGVSTAFLAGSDGRSWACSSGYINEANAKSAALTAYTANFGAPIQPQILLSVTGAGWGGVVKAYDDNSFQFGISYGGKTQNAAILEAKKQALAGFIDPGLAVSETLKTWKL